MNKLVKYQEREYTPSTDTELGTYLSHIHSFPLLELREEQDLARRYNDDGDVEAAHAMVTSHLRLVAKLAMGYRGYGLPIMDLIAEGNVGLMQAVKRFDPDKGFRLATYAMWWIKASIQEYVLRSWSLVRLGTTGSQKRLFFNLRRVKDRLLKIDGKGAAEMSHQNIIDAAEELGVRTDEIVRMDGRLTMRDASLNVPVFDEADSAEMQDFLVDDSADQEDVYIVREQAQLQSKLLVDAMGQLNDRERSIVQRRRLQDDSDTLEELSREFGVSRERVRQIEVRAIEKLKQFMLGSDKGMALHAV
ncbi:MAG: RNA polymerase sigma factor RpoH [Alphaproteobacteria bacterium]|nr:RNA polymerase sigma factor RpoH [Alphaproteobacteria bacterium]